MIKKSKNSSLSVFFACHFPVDIKTVNKVRLLNKFLPFINFSYYITTEGYKAIVQNKKIRFNEKYIELSFSDQLFDFSRYFEFLELDNSAQNVLLINDTLGSGRKFNFGLWIYLYISCILIHLKFIKIAAPVDSDHIRTWICPYFILGSVNHLKKMNWCDWKLAKKNLSSDEIYRIDKWLRENWRSRKGASLKQINTKKKVMILERCLMKNLSKTTPLFAFSKANPLRWLNSFI